MSPNPDTVNGKLEVIQEGLRFLEEEEHDLSVYRDRQAVKYTLQESIEACLDIANHIIASDGLGRPEDYAGYFPCLARHDIIPDDLADKLADMARFRNVLVHLYDEVDLQAIQDILQNDLGDIRAFTKHVYVYMDERL